jgi:hypothetical protein
MEMPERLVELLGGVLYVLLWVVGAYFLWLLFWAPLKLYSIDRSLKRIVELHEAEIVYKPVEGQAGVGSMFGR